MLKRTPPVKHLIVEEAAWAIGMLTTGCSQHHVGAQLGVS